MPTEFPSFQYKSFWESTSLVSQVGIHWQGKIWLFRAVRINCWCIPDFDFSQDLWNGYHIAGFSELILYSLFNLWSLCKQFDIYKCLWKFPAFSDISVFDDKYLRSLHYLHMIFYRTTIKKIKYRHQTLIWNRIGGMRSCLAPSNIHLLIR